MHEVYTIGAAILRATQGKPIFHIMATSTIAGYAVLHKVSGAKGFCEESTVCAGECIFCKHPESNLCSAVRQWTGKGVMRSDNKTRITAKGKSIYHFMGTSTFAEYAVLHKESVAKVSKDAALDKICLLGCGVSTGWGAVCNTAKVHKGATAAVFGIGTVGLAVIEALQECSAKRIIAVDTNPTKESMAREWGATDFVNPKVPISLFSLSFRLIFMMQGAGPLFRLSFIPPPVALLHILLL
jgi:Zn-dependent alcohol dehydrogenase